MDFFEDSEKIIIERKKIIDYLLNVAHPDGTGKAKVLIQYGFHPEKWEDFYKNIIEHAQNSKVVSDEETPFGRKIGLVGDLKTPSGKGLNIKSIWIVYMEIPILVTLYPIKK